MKPVATVNSTTIHQLVGGTRENDLPSEVRTDSDGSLTVTSVWEPTEEERDLIAEGYNIRLVVWGGQPPVALSVTDEETIPQ